MTHLASRAVLRVGPALLSLGIAAFVASAGRADEKEHVLHTFDRQMLTDVYYSEGIAAGDLNNDGHVDIIYGPYWFAGPAFEKQHEIYPAKPQPRERYADHFFAWTYDFDGDGWLDVFTVGFPGTPAYVYQNPGADGHDRPWPKHQVVDSVSNESPQLMNLVGDERPELVCSQQGFFGYATWDPQQPFAPWKFHAISEKVAPVPFGHGLGVGDVDGDGRLDVIIKDGWYAQPASLDAPRWKFHEAKFAPRGGADMFAYDVNGDGLNDVITSLAAHEFGLAWHEQVRDGDKITFREHLIMGDQPEQNRYGVLFSELHSVNLVDIDGDGLKDIVTGKTYWSHHTKSPMWDAGAVVYWFRLVRGPEGSVDWVPYQADGESGIGRQVIVTDINGDGLPDIAAGGMKGAHVLLHRREAVSADRWRAAQPKPHEGAARRRPRGTPIAVDAQSGRVRGAIEGEAMTVLRATAGKARTQPMEAFTAGTWSGAAQLFWNGAAPGERLDLELPVAEEGEYQIAAALTMAHDYAIVQFHLDDEPLNEPLDLYNGAEVISTGELVLGARKLSAGPHRLSIEIKGANPAAARKHMVGLDYVRLLRQ